MLKVIKHLDDRDVEQKVVDVIERALLEVKRCLPHLDTNIQIYFDDFCMMEEYGCGGFAYSPDTLTVAFSLDYSDKPLQLKYLRETIFHEAYHLAQGYTAETFGGTPLEEAVYEGAATLFERDFAGAEPAYATYDTQKVMGWLSEIRRLPKSYDMDRWKFFDPDDKERWKLYKTGAYINEQYLRLHPERNLLDMNLLTARQILEGSAVLDG